jgi:hypothetical protein
MSLFFRILMVLFALVVAVMAAGVTIATGMFVPDWGMMETDPMDRAIFFVVAFFATSFAGMTAFVPALLAVIVAEALNLRSFLYYGTAGGVIGLLGYFGSNISTRLEDTTDITPVGHSLELVAAAGIVGGLAYWLLAGRNAGRWRQTGGF